MLEFLQCNICITYVLALVLRDVGSSVKVGGRGGGLSWTLQFLQCTCIACIVCPKSGVGGGGLSKTWLPAPSPLMEYEKHLIRTSEPTQLASIYFCSLNYHVSANHLVNCEHTYVDTEFRDGLAPT